MALTIYLPTFEAAVKQAHVGAIMDSYNFINDVHATQNGYVNVNVVRKQWGFDGEMMSDWRSTYDVIAAANGSWPRMLCVSAPPDHKENHALENPCPRIQP